MQDTETSSIERRKVNQSEFVLPPIFLFTRPTLLFVAGTRIHHEKWFSEVFSFFFPISFSLSSISFNFFWVFSVVFSALSPFFSFTISFSFLGGDYLVHCMSTKYPIATPCPAVYLALYMQKSVCLSFSKFLTRKCGQDFY